jgi:hypothetical protein
LFHLPFCPDLTRVSQLPEEFVEFAGKNPEYVRLLLDVRKERKRQERRAAAVNTPPTTPDPTSKKND